MTNRVKTTDITGTLMRLIKEKTVKLNNSVLIWILIWMDELYWESKAYLNQMRIGRYVRFCGKTSQQQNAIPKKITLRIKHPEPGGLESTGPMSLPWWRRSAEFQG